MIWLVTTLETCVCSIFLLHGPPGVGKTLTAEAIAELLHRPLYSITVGELGITTVSQLIINSLTWIYPQLNPWESLLLTPHPPAKAYHSVVTLCSRIVALFGNVDTGSGEMTTNRSSQPYPTLSITPHNGASTYSGFISRLIWKGS